MFEGHSRHLGVERSRRALLAERLEHRVGPARVVTLPREQAARPHVAVDRRVALVCTEQLEHRACLADEMAARSNSQKTASPPGLVEDGRGPRIRRPRTTRRPLLARVTIDAPTARAPAPALRKGSLGLLCSGRGSRRCYRKGTTACRRRVAFRHGPRALHEAWRLVCPLAFGDGIISSHLTAK